MRLSVKHLLTVAALLLSTALANASPKARVLITSDGEVDDKCSLVRLLLYANEMDIEGLITTSSQYHWQGHRWAGDDWLQPYLEAYAQVYPNLSKHASGYPTPEYLRSRCFLGNVKAEGEMTELSAGSEYIVKVLLDDSDKRPLWVQAWGGTNTIARALKTIEEQHPEKMAHVAAKIRFFFLWEQDDTYQNYILPHWGRFQILTIISDQFWAFAYDWPTLIPGDKLQYFQDPWMQASILKNHGSLCALYEAKENGDFRSEGDSLAFLHCIPNGLRSMEDPSWGGWGGRYVRVRANTWLDEVKEPGYRYPEGRWYTLSAWGRKAVRDRNKSEALMGTYFDPFVRWAEVLQNEFAARADWCVKKPAEANHPPFVKLDGATDLQAKPGETVRLNAAASTDPDGDTLKFHWWLYRDAGTCNSAIELRDAESASVSFTTPSTAAKGETLHLICEVRDSGSPQLTRYQRVVVTITP